MTPAELESWLPTTPPDPTLYLRQAREVHQHGAARWALPETPVPPRTALAASPARPAASPARPPGASSWTPARAWAAVDRYCAAALVDGITSGEAVYATQPDVPRAPEYTPQHTTAIALLEARIARQEQYLALNRDAPALRLVLPDLEWHLACDRLALQEVLALEEQSWAWENQRDAAQTDLRAAKPAARQAAVWLRAQRPLPPATPDPDAWRLLITLVGDERWREWMARSTYTDPQWRLAAIWDWWSQEEDTTP